MALLSRALEARVLHLIFSQLLLLWSHSNLDLSFLNYPVNTKMITLHPLMLRVQLEFGVGTIHPLPVRSKKKKKLSLGQTIKLSLFLLLNLGEDILFVALERFLYFTFKLWLS